MPQNTEDCRYYEEHSLQLAGIQVYSGPRQGERDEEVAGIISFSDESPAPLILSFTLRTERKKRL